MTQVSLPSDDSARITGDAAVLARRYSGALYDLSVDSKQLDAVAADMRFLQVLQHESAEMRLIASHPRLTEKQRIAAVQALSSSAKLNALTTNFLGLLAQKHRLSLMGDMARAFLSRFAAERGEFTAEVVSAKPLSAAQQEKLATTLHELAGGKVHLSLREDTSLLGGLVVKLGSKLIDASVKSTLARLERQLKAEQTISQKGAA